MGVREGCRDRNRVPLRPSRLQHAAAETFSSPSDEALALHVYTPRPPAGVQQEPLSAQQHRVPQVVRLHAAQAAALPVADALAVARHFLALDARLPAKQPTVWVRKKTPEPTEPPGSNRSSLVPSGSDQSSLIQFDPVQCSPVGSGPVRSRLGSVVFRTLVRSSVTCTSACRGWSSRSRRPGPTRSPPLGSSASPSGPGSRPRRTLEPNPAGLSQQPSFLYWRPMVRRRRTHRCCGTATPTRPEASPARSGLLPQCSAR